jgi:hypothetical protein
MCPENLTRESRTYYPPWYAMREKALCERRKCCLANIRKEFQIGKPRRGSCLRSSLGLVRLMMAMGSNIMRAMDPHRESETESVMALSVGIFIDRMLIAIKAFCWTSRRFPGGSASGIRVMEFHSELHVILLMSMRVRKPKMTRRKKRRVRERVIRLCTHSRQTCQPTDTDISGRNGRASKQRKE